MPPLHRSPIWSDPRVKPPFGSVEIDWAHPLSTGLKAVFLFNELAGNPHNLVSGTVTTKTASPTWVPTLKGPAGRFGTSSYYRDPGFVTPAGAELSVVYQLFPRNTGFFIGSNANGNWALSNGTFVVQFWGNTNFSSGISTVNLTPNVWSTLVLTLNAAKTTKFYFDGVDTSSSNSSNAVQAITGLNIGGDPINGSFLDHDNAFALVYLRRVLSQMESQQLSKEPYAFLRPIIRRRYFVPPAATGGKGSFFPFFVPGLLSTPS